MVLESRSSTELTALLLSTVITLAVSGCASTEPIAELTFGSDYRGTQGKSVTLSGAYLLELQCANGGDLRVAVRVDDQTLEEFVMPCEAKATRRIEVAPPVTGFVEVAVDGEGQGTAKLLEDR